MVEAAAPQATFSIVGGELCVCCLFQSFTIRLFNGSTTHGKNKCFCPSSKTHLYSISTMKNDCIWYGKKKKKYYHLIYVKNATVIKAVIISLDPCVRKQTKPLRRSQQRPHGFYWYCNNCLHHLCCYYFLSKLWQQKFHLWICVHQHCRQTVALNVYAPVGGLRARGGSWIPSRVPLPATAAAVASLPTLCTAEHALYQTSCV